MTDRKEIVDSLDTAHPAVGALAALLPDGFTFGGSFANWLPNPATLSPQARREEFLRAQSQAKKVCIDGLAKLAGLPMDLLEMGLDATGVRSWPVGFVGSTTDKGTVVLAALIDVALTQGLGIDLELVDQKRLDEVQNLIAPEGQPDGVDRDIGTLICFSAKEAVFKAHFPISRTPLAFSDIRLEWKHLVSGVFTATSRVTGLADCAVTSVITGNWILSIALLPLQQSNRVAPRSFV